jgi:hypothetical protein
VFLEVWYPDEAAMQACSAMLNAPEARQEIRADEERLFDTRFMRSYIVDEYVSELSES